MLSKSLLHCQEAQPRGLPGSDTRKLRNSGSQWLLSPLLRVLQGSMEASHHLHGFMFRRCRRPAIVHQQGFTRRICLTQILKQLSGEIDNFETLEACELVGHNIRGMQGGGSCSHCTCPQGLLCSQTVHLAMQRQTWTHIFSRRDEILTELRPGRSYMVPVKAQAVSSSRL